LSTRAAPRTVGAQDETQTSRTPRDLEAQAITSQLCWSTKIKAPADNIQIFGARRNSKDVLLMCGMRRDDEHKVAISLLVKNSEVF